MPDNFLSENRQESLNFLAKSIALIILDKLKNDYFNKDNPGIIAISTAMLNPSLMFFSTQELSSYLKENLPKLLNELVRNEEKEKILNNQKNLYAVLIDTTTYNWFPEVAKEHYGANFPEGYDNCYLVINNLSFSGAHERILNSLVPYSIEMSLNIGDLQEQPVTLHVEKKVLMDKHAKIRLLFTELYDCSRQIQIWLRIAQEKEKNGIVKFESFWGFLQYSFPKSIVIDSYKLLKHTKSYIQLVLKDIFTKDQLKSLIKNSKLQERLSNLEKVIMPLKDFRNKRYAHIENVELQAVSCNLRDLFIALSGLLCSLNYIESFLLNPHYIYTEEWEWGMCIVNAVDAGFGKDPLSRYFQEDPSVNDCLKMLEELNKLNVN